MEVNDSEKTAAFIDVFCGCYSEYVKAIETLKIKNRNLFKDEVSPGQFLSYHNGFKNRILNNDATVLRDLSYLNRRRCLSLEPSNEHTLLMFLSNLCIYAKLATKSYEKLSAEEQVMGDNILNRHFQRKLDITSTGTEDDVWQEMLAEISQDIGESMNEENSAYIRQKMEHIAAENPSGAVNHMDVVRLLLSDNGDGGPIDIMSVVQKISNRITAKMNSGQLDEGALLRQSMRLMKCIPKQ